MKLFLTNNGQVLNLQLKDFKENRNVVRTLEDIFFFFLTF